MRNCSLLIIRAVTLDYTQHSIAHVFTSQHRDWIRARVYSVIICTTILQELQIEIMGLILSANSDWKQNTLFLTKFYYCTCTCVIMHNHCYIVQSELGD